MTHSFYDKKARPLRTYQSNHLGGYTQTDVKLDFIGTALYTVTKHKKTNTNAEITVLEGFDYTPEGRLLEHTHKINNLAIETLSHNEYDELGQLIIKRVGKIPSTPLQTVDYKYNIRGWLTDINNVETLGDDLFAFKLSYNDVKNSVWGLVKPLYNGNISETFWKTSTDNQIRKYGYIYDDLNRLDNSIYQKAPTVNAQNSAITSYDSYNEGNLIYDKNGNIIQIRRNGDLDSEEFNIQIDWLYYDYDSGNKLLKVSDGSNHPEGFKDGADTTIEYGYDAFGNMTRDDNKSIASITYNHLNLPKQILFSGTPSRKINYLYNALGQKVEKKITNNLTETVTNYQGMFHYENQVLKFIGTSEGYVNVTSGRRTENGPSYVFSYIYNYTDHLGNIRLSYTKGKGTNPAVILEENHYYPFGLKHKKYGSVDKDFVVIDEETGAGYEVGIDIVPPQTRKPYQYKYNGQEWQDELDLNVTAMDFRQYDNALGRFHNMDRLTGAMPSISPYHFGYNNPVYWSDPSGLMPEWAQGMWNATPNGTNSHWVNDGYENFDNTDGSGYVNRHGEYFAHGFSVELPELHLFYTKKGGSSNNFWNSVEQHVYKHSPFYSYMTSSRTITNDITSCHHTTTFSQSSGIDWSIFSLSDRQSGYIQYGGEMSSDFIGSSIGKNGVIYGAQDNFFTFGTDIQTRLQMLRYIMDIKGGLEIGSRLGEILFGGEDVNFKTFNYETVDTLKGHAGGSHVFKMFRRVSKKGYIINGDTLR